MDILNSPPFKLEWPAPQPDHGGVQTALWQAQLQWQAMVGIAPPELSDYQEQPQEEDRDNGAA